MIKIKTYYQYLIKENKNSIGRIVLTGVSGSGKTTIINELKKLGYNIVDEVARRLISELKEKDETKLPWNNRDEFQKLVEENQIDNYINNQNSFFDRGIVDEIAYREAYNREVPKHLIDLCKKYKYDKVFIFSPFKDIYSTDEERVESFEESSKLYDYLLKSYKNFDYQPIIMINDTVENRIKFIIEEINKKLNI